MNNLTQISMGNQVPKTLQPKPACHTVRDYLPCDSWLKFFREQFKRKDEPVTVCIAAICEGQTILGAADRMLTSADVEFEPNLDKLDFLDSFPPEVKYASSYNQKICPITNYITILGAGDSGLQMDIVNRVRDVVHKRIFTHTDLYWGVREVCDLYVSIYEEIKQKRMQLSVFEPFGLTGESFISRQLEMKDGFIREMTERMQQFEFTFSDRSAVETIVTGLDMTGFDSKTGKSFLSPHLYTLHNDHLTCCDSVGFAAIGSGSRHAESQFMLSEYTKFSKRDETLLLVYVAKKHAEIAPGVGSGTDMFTIGPPPGGTFTVLNNVEDLELQMLDKIFSEMTKVQKTAFDAAKAKVKAHIEAVFKKRSEKSQQNQIATGSEKSIPPLDNPK
ncbi:MAG TPA: hypothetical protein VHB20_00855 [Verrucomicrobiae bacterium]|jgi:hypothetical protein|nr:hypothetical protein [Verrucomicrobiae bacterium]